MHMCPSVLMAFFPAEPLWAGHLLFFFLHSLQNRTLR